MRKTLTLSMILATAIGASSLAFATPGGSGFAHGGHRHHGMMGMRDLHQVDLTDAQHDTIKQMMKQGFTAMKPRMQALRQQRDAFEAMTPDAAGYQDAATRLAQAEADFTRERVMQQATMRAQIYGVLTDAQKTKLASLQAQHKAKREAWKAKHRSQSNDASSQ
ncbi:MAG: Spy/CpxP family protein refolding chaperone [Rhodanobacteraceae bacterium]